MIRGLYIGRFQPYHNGHDKMMSIISSNVDEVIIGIGSSQESYTLYNPFTYEERLRMI